MSGVIHGLVSVVFLFFGAMVVLSAVAGWQIVRKAGYPGWWVLIIGVPVVGAVFFFLFAFSDWPVLQRLRQLESGPGDTGRVRAPGSSVPPAHPPARPALNRPEAPAIAVLALGVCYFLLLFFAWSSASVCTPEPVGGAPYCVSTGAQTGWGGLGVIPGLLVAGLLAWEGLSWGRALGRVDHKAAALAEPVLAAAIALFTVARVLADPGGSTVAAWLGVLVSAGLAGLAVVRWRAVAHERGGGT